MVIQDSLEIKNLSVGFKLPQGVFYAVDDVSIRLSAGKFTAIIGESGCGKSVLGQAVLNILPQGVVKKGVVFYKGERVQSILSAFGIIPQNPSGSLNPVRKIGRQMQDILDVYAINDADNAYKLQCLHLFGLQEAERALAAYPHELSGGMLQRVLCAMAVSTKPAWILADEPTKGLDEQVGAIVRENLLTIKHDLHLSMLVITHDIALAQEVCDDVLVMYAGQILEYNTDLWRKPLHPYTQGFLQALPQNGLQVIPGKAPVPGESFSGCKFAARCPHCMKRCREQRPDMYQVGDAQVRCFLYAEG